LLDGDVAIMIKSKTIGHYRISATRHNGQIEYIIWDIRRCAYLYVGTNKARAKMAMKLPMAMN
jgi:hypothetical protein